VRTKVVTGRKSGLGVFLTTLVHLWPKLRMDSILALLTLNAYTHAYVQHFLFTFFYLMMKTSRPT
jgi:hypothetical protein